MNSNVISISTDKITRSYLSMGSLKVIKPLTFFPKFTGVSLNLICSTSIPDTRSTSKAECLNTQLLQEKVYA